MRARSAIAGCARFETKNKHARTRTHDARHPTQPQGHLGQAALAGPRPRHEDGPGRAAAPARPHPDRRHQAQGGVQVLPGAQQGLLQHPGEARHLVRGPGGRGPDQDDRRARRRRPPGAQGRLEADGLPQRGPPGRRRQGRGQGLLGPVRARHWRAHRLGVGAAAGGAVRGALDRPRRQGRQEDGRGAQARPHQGPHRGARGHHGRLLQGRHLGALHGPQGAEHVGDQRLHHARARRAARLPHGQELRHAQAGRRAGADLPQEQGGLVGRAQADGRVPREDLPGLPARGRPGLRPGRLRLPQGQHQRRAEGARRRPPRPQARRVGAHGRAGQPLRRRGRHRV